ncbi:MAG: T9SS type A sorting domain-containing protein, partial [Kangiellaceae bacterium]|nr:T9SS type A sorting domain-containing protein [Kangiellaceae bacterium]
VDVPVGTSNYEAKIKTTNDAVTNDVQPFTVKVEAPKLTIKDKKVTISFPKFDDYPDEVGFALKKGAPTAGLVEDWNSTSADNSIAYAAIKSLSGSSYSQDFDIDENGCYYFMVVDGYGDGITYNNPNGVAKLISDNTVTIPGDWGQGVIVRVEFDGIVGTEEYTNMSEFSIHPNPVSDIANVAIALTEVAHVQVEVVNLLGQTVNTLDLGQVVGTRNFQISTADLSEGIYLVNIVADGYTTTKKISVVK